MKKTNPLSISEITAIANNTRVKFDIALDEPFPILPIIEKLVGQEEINLEIVEDEKLTDVYAYYEANSNTIFVRESVYNECYTGVYRSNFTLAHEFFHYLQAKILQFSFEDVPSTVAYCDAEWQANEFAAQLLLPTAFLDLPNEVLVEKFQVFLECVLTRKLKMKKRKNYIKLN